MPKLPESPGRNLDAMRRRSQQRKISRQIQTGTFEPSKASKKAREVAERMAPQRAAEYARKERIERIIDWPEYETSAFWDAYKQIRSA